MRSCPLSRTGWSEVGWRCRLALLVRATSSPGWPEAVRPRGAHPVDSRGDPATPGPSEPVGWGPAGLAAAVVGSLLVSLCAGLVSRAVWRTGSLTLPWGLLLSIAGSVCVVGLARAIGGRRLGIAAGASWLCGIGVVLFWHPGGDYVFASDGLGLTFLLAGPVAVTATALRTGQ